MTIADLIEDVERLRPDMRLSKTAFVAFLKAESRAARAMARAGVFVVRIGTTFYVRYNNSLTYYRDVPEASNVPVADASNMAVEED